MAENEKIIQNEVTEEELSELDDEEIEFDEEEDEEEYEDDEDCTITKVINIVKQPIVTTVVVGAEVDSKGVVKPMVKISIERHIEGGNIEIDEYDVIAQDFEALVTRTKQIIALKEKLN